MWAVVRVPDGSWALEVVDVGRTEAIARERMALLIRDGEERDPLVVSPFDPMSGRTPDEVIVTVNNYETTALYWGNTPPYAAWWTRRME